MDEVAFTDFENVAAAGGKVIPDKGVELHGWRVESFHGPMSGDADLENLKSELGGAIRIPEIVFSKNVLRLRHLLSGCTIEFNAMEALESWRTENLPPFQLDISEVWQDGKRNDIERHQAKQLHYDWTFTTGYRGSVRLMPSSHSEASPSSQESVFLECKDGLDYGLLKSRDEPILFYDAISLYESELDDRGFSQCKVWIRVMPHYWFVVLRYFLRVDHHLIRLRETRLFCRFEEHRNEIVRDVKHWEVTFEELKQSGAPMDMNHYKNAESTAETLRSVFHTGLVMDVCEKSGALDGLVAAS